MRRRAATGKRLRGSLKNFPVPADKRPPGRGIDARKRLRGIPYADAIEYGENTSALFKALWELTDLIRLESDLKKHHRAYLHVREDIDEKVKEARQIMTKVAVDMIGFYFNVDVSECSNNDENTPFADAGEDETVSIPKGEYELMIDDLLTMSEIIQCVADMRTQDVKAIREFGKFVPAFAAFEKNRLNLYREAAKEAEEMSWARQSCFLRRRLIWRCVGLQKRR